MRIYQLLGAIILLLWVAVQPLMGMLAAAGLIMIGFFDHDDHDDYEPPLIGLA